MKELLEEYVLENHSLKQQVDLLARLVSIATFEDKEILMSELTLVELVNITVEGGVVTVG